MKVFVHGVPDTSFMWTPIVKALHLPEADYMSPTMPGFDGATPPGFASTQDAYVDWMIETLDGVAKTHGPVDLVGHDWGAIISSMAAQKRPELIRSWTIINAAPEPSYRWHRLARIWQTPLLGELFFALGSKKMLHRSLVEAGMPKPMADHEASSFDRHTERAILKLYRSAKKPSSMTMDFSNIADRGLVLWGAEDPYVTLQVARRFCERWDLPLAVVNGVGHWGICEKPEAFAAHLTAHWSN